MRKINRSRLEQLADAYDLKIHYFGSIGIMIISPKEFFRSAKAGVFKILEAIVLLPLGILLVIIESFSEIISRLGCFKLFTLNKITDDPEDDIFYKFKEPREERKLNFDDPEDIF